MASIKQRKSKGKADCLSVIGDGLSYGYEVRKMNALGNTRSHLVRPLRAIRKVYEQALQAWERAVVKGDAAIYPYAEESTYYTAVIAARAGQGHLLHRLAA